MARAIRCFAAGLLLAGVLIVCERSAQAQVVTTYYAPAVPVTSYFAPAPAYYAPAYTTFYSPAVVATPAVTRVRVRRPWLRPQTTVVRQRTVPAAVVPTAAYYWRY